MKPYDLPDARGHFGPYGGIFVAEPVTHANAAPLLFNAWGQPVALPAWTAGQPSLDVSTLAPGRYVLEFRTDAGTYRAAFLKL